MAQSRKDALPKALEKLTEGIYMECLEHGPESVYLCRSYFFMGQLFQLMNDKVSAKAFFSKIVEIWRRFIIDNDLNEELMDYQLQEIEPLYYEEAQKHLFMIANWFMQEFGQYDIAAAEVRFSHSLVQLKRGYAADALNDMRKALDDYRKNLGDYDHRTKEVEDTIMKIERLLARQN